MREMTTNSNFPTSRDKDSNSLSLCVNEEVSNGKTVPLYLQMQLNGSYLMGQPSELLDCTRKCLVASKSKSPILRTKKLNDESVTSKEVQTFFANERAIDQCLINLHQPEEKSKQDAVIDIFKCNCCPFVTLKLAMMELHVNENKGRCGEKVKVLQCPACNDVFTTVTSLRVHLIHDHNMIVKDVKLIVNSLNRVRLQILCPEKSSCVYAEQDSMGFPAAADDADCPMALTMEQCDERPSCAKEKRNAMLEAYLDNINHKSGCLPPGISQSGSDLLENTFNFTAPVSEQLPSIQPENPPPSNQQEDEELINANDIAESQNGSYLGLPNGFVDSRQTVHLSNDYRQSVDYQYTMSEISSDHYQLSYNQSCVENSQTEQRKSVPKKPNYGFRCDINGCKIRMQSEKNIQYHRRCHENTMFNCPECCKDCPTWVSLSSHLWQVHQIDMELYKCDQCPYRTPSYSTLTGIHRGIHGTTKPYLCDICGKGFKTVKQMRNHKVVHKAKMVRMSGCFCEICGRTLSNKRLLKVHMSNLHKKKKPFLCNICGFTTGMKHSLTLHMRKHTGEKPHKCDKCEYTTGDHNALRKHKMKHTGARLYKCPHCMYSSIQSTTYKAHIKRKHPGLDATLIFSCSQCNFHTLQHGLYLAHSAQHGNGQQTSKQLNESGFQQQQQQQQQQQLEVPHQILDSSVTNTTEEPIVDLCVDHSILQHDGYYTAVEVEPL